MDNMHSYITHISNFGLRYSGKNLICTDFLEVVAAKLNLNLAFIQTFIDSNRLKIRGSVVYIMS